MKKTNHLKLLCDIEEINQLFTATKDIDAFPQKIVDMVASHMHTKVCSIYFYNNETETLKIKANKGLDQIISKKVQLSKGEGLVGKALSELRPICLKEASLSPDFKFFPGLSEEDFDAFLAVPICQGINRIGVLVVQREKQHPFTKQDVSALKVIASQLGYIISQIILFMNAGESTRPCTKELLKHLKFIKAKVAASGYAFSKTYVYTNASAFSFFTNTKDKKIYTEESFELALKKTQRQLEELQKSIEEKLSDVASLIFTAHLLILKDNKFIGEMRKLISKGINPPKAILDVGKKYIDIFSSNPNKIIQEKTQDIEDLLKRLLLNLISKNSNNDQNYSNHIVIAKQLFPSDILKMSSENVDGIILISGGVTSHLSVLSRSLHIPLVIIDKTELLDIPNGTNAIIDAEIGNIYINPDKNTIEQFKKQRTLNENIRKNEKLLKNPAKTKDGTRIKLLSNINLLSDISAAKECHSDGIGLYRTEFPFLIRNDFPTEEEQYVIYKKLVTDMGKSPITFRTLDIGGDKLLSYYLINEQNPFLGFRSIRFSLKHKEVFTQQIRAILRAGKDAQIRIMFPMISSIDEFIEAKKVLSDCLVNLQNENIEHNNNPGIGIMVEIPSIITILDEIAKEVDFFSIGTNDLIQFFLAVDRTNEKVASFYNPLHPSILRTLKTIVQVANKNKIDVSLCGDMAHEGKFLPFLLGIGLKSLSLDPIYIPRIKQTLTNVDLNEAKQVADKMLKESTIVNITNVLVDFFDKKIKIL